MSDERQEKLPTDEELPTSADGEKEVKDPLSDVALRKAMIKSYLQIQEGVRAIEKADKDATNGTPKPQVDSDKQLVLHFSRSELNKFVAHREKGRADKTKYWIHKASEALCDCTRGDISHSNMERLTDHALQKYTSVDSHSKLLSFAKGFLKHLAQHHVDPRYLSFTLFLDLPKTVKERHAVTSQIVTKEDIKNVLAYIRAAEKDKRINSHRAQQYTAFIVFGASTGQRSLATMAKLTVGQIKQALLSDTPCIEVLSSQDKVKMAHYVPLAPRVIKAIQPLLEGRRDDDLLFEYNSIVAWLKREKIPLTRVANSFTLSSLRKFAEQFGDVIQWDSSNRAYIMTHGVSGVDWKHYKHPLPENVYKIYLQYWGDVDLIG